MYVRFETIVLTMWEAFVERECILIANNIAKKPVLVGNHLKVSSFNGLFAKPFPKHIFGYNSLFGYYSKNFFFVDSCMYI
jgi:hypothetical protein